MYVLKPYWFSMWGYYDILGYIASEGAARVTMPTVPAVPATLPGYAIHRESAYDAVKLQSSVAAAASSSSRAAVVKRVTFVRHAEGAFVCLFVRSLCALDSD